MRRALIASTIMLAGVLYAEGLVWSYSTMPTFHVGVHHAH